ncbi:MAG: hypothetical protein RML56_02845 [Burkholderiales bacterium]|nr:hypothetical protein [Burkholderiales bacterium]
MSAYPRPVSPLNWTVIMEQHPTHHFAHVNLRGARRREPRPGDGLLAARRPLPAARRTPVGTRQPLRRTPRTRGCSRAEAAGSPALAFFRWFAEAPAADGVTEGSDCIGFLDLRFVTPVGSSCPSV